jgi:hypothetical protein
MQLDPESNTWTRINSSKIFEGTTTCSINAMPKQMRPKMPGEYNVAASVPTEIDRAPRRIDGREQRGVLLLP